MNKDRGIIKWAPFSSVENPTIMINNIEKKKNFNVKPVLSKEQIEDIENNILESLHNQSIIHLVYLQNGKILKIAGVINKLDSVKRTIILDNGTTLFFEQIINSKIS